MKKLKVIPTKAGRIHLGTKELSLPSDEAKTLVALGLAKYPKEPPPQIYMTRDMVAVPRRTLTRRAAMTTPEPKTE